MTTTIERNNLGDDPGFPARVKALLQKEHYTDEDIDAVGRDRLTGLLEYMSRTGQLSPTSTRIETTKTANKRPVFVFRPGDDAVLSEECANGHCLSTDGSFEWGSPKSANAGCCGHKDCGTPASEVCECLCHAGGEQVGTMLDGEPA